MAIKFVLKVNDQNIGRQQQQVPLNVFVVAEGITMEVVGMYAVAKQWAAAVFCHG